MLPEISNLEFQQEETVESSVVHKTFDWDFENGTFVLKDGKLVELEGIEYIKVWINKVLRTKAWTLIYQEYGSEHQSLIGKVYDKEFVRAELERTIQEALLKNEAITNVYDFEFESDGMLLNISFSAATIYGSTEVTING